MKKIIGMLVILFSLFGNLQVSYGYGSETSALIGVDFVDLSGEPLKNYRVNVLSGYQKEHFLFTNSEGRLNAQIKLPTSLEKSNGEYYYGFRVGMSTVVLFNEKLSSGLTVFYDKEDGRIKKIEGSGLIESDYSIQNRQKRQTTAYIPSGFPFLKVFFIGIFVFIVNFVLFFGRNDRFLRMRNSTFQNK